MIVKNIKNKVSLFALVFFSCMYPITLGFYCYDLVVLVSVLWFVFFYKFEIKKNESEYLNALVYFLFIPNILLFLYQLVTDAEIVIGNIYILYNLTLSMLYIYFIRFYIISYVSSHPYLTTIFLMTPLLISMAMLISSSFNTLIVAIYGIDKQYDLRFGGIWGRDVNQLGYYCSILLIWSTSLLAFKKINVAFYCFVFLICIILTLLSGMRTGLAVFIVSFAIVSLISKQYRTALIYNVSILFSTLFLLILLLPFLDGLIDIENILDRFSFELFWEQLSGSSGDGHIGNMFVKWLTAFSNEENIGHILFSFDASWKFPDSFILYYLANGGLVGVFLLVIFMLYCLYLIVKTKSYTGFMVLMVVTAVAFKGNYPMNNMSMFIFTLLIYFESAMKLDLKDASV